MTRMLKKAFEEASQLPENAQGRIAGIVMTELRSRRSNEDRMQDSSAGGSPTRSCVIDQRPTGVSSLSLRAPRPRSFSIRSVAS